MKSRVDQRLEKAWPTIEKLIKEVLGKPEERLVRRLADVRAVDPWMRVVVAEVRVTKSDSTQFDGGELQEQEFTGTLVPVDRRRYVLRMTEEQLERLATAPEKKADEDRIRAWAEAALQNETAKVLAPLVGAAGTSLRGEISKTLLNEAKRALNLSDGVVRFIVPKERLSKQLRDELEKELGKENLIEVRAKTLPDNAVAIVINPAGVAPVMHQAVDLELGWNAAGDGVDVVLEQRASRVHVPDKSKAIVKVVAPPSGAVEKGES